jgi:hypothetical protein
MLNLPKRKDELHLLDFSEEELDLYSQVKAQTRAKVDDLGTLLPSRTFLSALQWINDLRLICNHGTASKILTGNPGKVTGSYEMTKQKRFQNGPDLHNNIELNDYSSEGTLHLTVPARETDLHSLATSAYFDDSNLSSPCCSNTPLSSDMSGLSWEPWSSGDAQTVFEELISIGISSCSKCNRDLALPEPRFEKASLIGTGHPRLSKYFHLLCYLCFGEDRLPAKGYLPVCNHRPRCNYDQVGVTSPPFQGPEFSSLPEVMEKSSTCTKITTLINDLCSRPRGEKR